MAHRAYKGARKGLPYILKVGRLGNPLRRSQFREFFRSLLGLCKNYNLAKMMRLCR